MPKLIKSTTDDVLLAHAVEVRFVELCGSYLRIKGDRLMSPPILDRDFLRWRTLRVRHKCKCGCKEIGLNKRKEPCCIECGKRGDYRHTEAEMKSTREIANWTVQVNAAIRNQPPVHVDFE